MHHDVLHPCTLRLRVDTICSIRQLALAFFPTWGTRPCSIPYQLSVHMYYTYRDFSNSDKEGLVQPQHGPAINFPWYSPVHTPQWRTSRGIFRLSGRAQASRKAYPIRDRLIDRARVVSRVQLLYAMMQGSEARGGGSKWERVGQASEDESDANV